MHDSRPARTPIRRIRVRRICVAGLLGVLAASTAAVGDQLRTPSSAPSPSSSTPAARTPVGRGKPHGAPRGVVPRTEDRGPVGESGGAVPDGTTVFADGIAAVANLDPALRASLRRAAADAAADGVAFVLDSGWRSPGYQEQLLREAVSKYGSETEALRWVATPDRSAHVKGDAVDIGSAGAGWLSAHGAAYGLCPVYDNEPWHYELRPEASARGCPARYADPTHDPRMQQR